MTLEGATSAPKADVCSDCLKPNAQILKRTLIRTASPFCYDYRVGAADELAAKERAERRRATWTGGIARSFVELELLDLAAVDRLE